jgi:hypothetical protein
MKVWLSLRFIEAISVYDSLSGCTMFSLMSKTPPNAWTIRKVRLHAVGQSNKLVADPRGRVRETPEKVSGERPVCWHYLVDAVHSDRFEVNLAADDLGWFVSQTRGWQPCQVVVDDDGSTQRALSLSLECILGMLNGYAHCGCNSRRHSLL